MFDAGTSSIVFLMTSSGVFYPQILLIPPFFQGIAHALLFALFQLPSLGNKWGPLQGTALYWDYTLQLLPLLAIMIIWMGRIMPPKPSA